MGNPKSDVLRDGIPKHKMRVALTGGTVSPGIHETVAAIGRDKTTQRLKAAIEYIKLQL